MISRSDGQVGQVVQTEEETNSHGPVKCIRLDQHGKKWRFSSGYAEEREAGARERERGTKGVRGKRRGLLTVSGDENERDKWTGDVTGREEIAARD